MPKDENRIEDPNKLIEKLRDADDEEGTEESALALARAELTYGIGVKEALLILNQLANAGSTEAMLIFAELFSKGMYYEKDERKAMRCLMRADELGDAEAAYQLGKRYRLGIGTAENEKYAIRYFFRASDRGHMGATYQLASIFFSTGRPEEGAEALKRCFDGGIEEAGYDYAMCLLYGDGVRQDVRRAVRLLEGLAASGDEEARAKLLFMYRTGFKVEKNLKKAEFYEVREA